MGSKFWMRRDFTAHMIDIIGHEIQNHSLPFIFYDFTQISHIKWMQILRCFLQVFTNNYFQVLTIRALSVCQSGNKSYFISGNVTGDEAAENYHPNLLLLRALWSFTGDFSSLFNYQVFNSNLSAACPFKLQTNERSEKSKL